jgi:hypothetical protein
MGMQESVNLTQKPNLRTPHRSCSIMAMLRVASQRQNQYDVTKRSSRFTERSSLVYHAGAKSSGQLQPAPPLRHRIKLSWVTKAVVTRVIPTTSRRCSLPGVFAAAAGMSPGLAQVHAAVAAARGKIQPYRAGWDKMPVVATSYR